MGMTVDWERFCEVIHQSTNIVLTSHIRPDCDALGSCLGMAGILESLGKTVRIVCGQKTPPNLQFIDPENKILAILEDISPEQISDADLQMIIDTSAWAQLGPMAEVIRDSSCKKIIFDHHVGEDDIDAELFKNTTAEAAGRMVFEAAEHLGVELTPQIATPLFAAIATDTGWFRFPAVTDLTYRTAAALLQAGAVPAQIYGDLYERIRRDRCWYAPHSSRLWNRRSSCCTRCFYPIPQAHSYDSQMDTCSICRAHQCIPKGMES